MKKNILILFLITSIFAVCFSCCKKDDNTFYGTLCGIVTDTTNNPIQGVEVSLSPSSTTVQTGSDGKYLFENLNSDTYTIQFRRAGYKTDTRMGSVYAGDVTIVSISMKTQ